MAQAELSAMDDTLTTARNLEQRLIYGSYPELWQWTTLQSRQII